MTYIKKLVLHIIYFIFPEIFVKYTNLVSREQNKSDNWMKELFDSHHSAIYAPIFEEGEIFNSS